MSIINKFLVVTPEMQASWNHFDKNIKPVKSKLYRDNKAKGNKGAEVMKECEAAAYLLDKLEAENNYYESLQ